MNILAVLYCYPPLLFPATLCYLKLVTGLRKYGYAVTAVTVDPGSFDLYDRSLLDTTLERFLPEGVVNYRVRSWESNALLKFLKGSGIGRDMLHRVFEPKKREWVFSAVRSLKKLDLSSYDLILSCSQPHANHLVGYWLKERTRKPWIAYFSDPWTDNMYAHYRSEKALRYNREWEDRVIGAADVVLFTSEEMLRLVMGKYPSGAARKCGVLPHSFIPEWYGLPGGLPEDTEREGGKLRFVHTGHFYGPRTPLPLFNALAALRKEMDLEERMEVHCYGLMEQEHRERAREEGLLRFVHLHPPVPYFSALSAMRNADYLLLVDAPLQKGGESVFLPSKLIDYLGSYRPVVGITPEEGASARVLR
ncbi:MAG: glycosyltransferase, partial [Nitrospirales bacterium]|nr:glycosyltransferase [Nitrospirales bacterium]